MTRLVQMVFNAEGTVGGEQKHVLHLIDGLDRGRFEVDVITWDIPAFARELERRGVSYHSVTADRILDRVLLARLEELLRAGRYDIVHTHGHRAGLLGRVAAIKAGVKRVVWTCHVAENKSERNPLLAWGYRRALSWLDSRTDVTIAVSEYLRDWLASQGTDPRRCLVVPNGVDTGVFRPGDPDTALLADLGLDLEAPIVGCVARLTEQKGVDTLIDAAALLAARVPRLQVLIVGGGPLEKELKARAAASEAGVVFAGERDDVPALLRLFDVAVVPSRWEGAFCFTVLEAMATGLPVVCSDIRLFTDVVRPDVEALVFPAGEAEALAAALERLLGDDDEARRLAAAGRELVEREYTVDKLRQRMRDVYEGLS